MPLDSKDQASFLKTFLCKCYL